MLSKIKVGFVLFFVIPLLFSCSQPQRWEVLGARYGVSEGMPLSKMVKGGSNEIYPMAWMFWIVRSDEKIVLVDCGFENENMLKKWKIEGYKRPVDILLEIGIKPDDVTDVILTHLHWDHAGSLSRFKNAKVWLQRAEWTWAQKVVDEDNRYSNGVFYDDVRIVSEVAKQNRLNLLDGDAEIYKGIHVVSGGCHTPGFQWVWVETLAGKIVIASDAAYLYENLEGPTPLACRNFHSSVRALNKMLSLARAKEQILCGHEPQIFSIFPKVSEHVFQVAPSVTQH